MQGWSTTIYSLTDYPQGDPVHILLSNYLMTLRVRGNRWVGTGPKRIRLKNECHSPCNKIVILGLARAVRYGVPRVDALEGSVYAVGLSLFKQLFSHVRQVVNHLTEGKVFSIGPMNASVLALVGCVRGETSNIL